jgi:ferredoxin-NADP reductase
MDLRGNRRTFSIESAPGDDEVKFVIKISERSSSFKKKLLGLKKGDHITAGHLAGDFVLPKDTSKKLVFIAGGIGITPFLSMVRHIIKTKQSRDIVLFYIVSQQSDFCYPGVWEIASQYGVRVIPVLTGEETAPSWKGLRGRLSKETIAKEVPDYTKRRYYLSGPNALVNAYRSAVTSFGVRTTDIVTDYFSGY